MKGQRAVCTFVLVVVCASGIGGQEGCVLPQDGRCSRDNYTIDSNEVYDIHHGSCEINSTTGLCSYQQGCADPGMSNWTRVGGGAQAKQDGTHDCGSDYYYSVLESPWLNLTYTSCLKFTYSRSTPAALDVFVEHRQAGIITALKRTDNPQEENKRENVDIRIPSGVGKVIFRAYGGGGGGKATVFKVSVDLGVCSWTGSLSEVIMPSQNVKRWTSPLISPTDSDRVDCVGFRYEPSVAGSNLTVSVQALGEDSTDTVWSYVSPGGKEVDGSCPIQVSAPYTILFEEEKAASSEEHDDVEVLLFHRSIRAHDCPWEPSDAGPPLTSSPVVTSPGTHVVTSSSNTRLTTGTGITPDDHTPTKGTADTRSTTDTHTLTTGRSRREEQTGVDAGVVGGSVAAAIVIIAVAVVVVVVVIVRRRRSSKKTENTRRTESVERRTDSGAASPSEKDNGDYSEIRRSHFSPYDSPSQEDSGYSEIGEVTLPTQDPHTHDPHTHDPHTHDPHAHDPHTHDPHTHDPHTHDPNTYFVIEKDSSEETPTTAAEDDYNHIGAGEPPNPGHISEDDYHHIFAGEPPNPGHTSEDDYHHIFARELSNPGQTSEDNYNHTFARELSNSGQTSEDDYNHTFARELSNPGQTSEDDYNHIFAGEPPNPGRTSEDDYHHINAAQIVPDPQPGNAYARVAQKGKTAPHPKDHHSQVDGQVLKNGDKRLEANTPARSVYSKAKLTPSKPALAPKPTLRRKEGESAEAARKTDSNDNYEVIPDPRKGIQTASTLDPGADDYHTISLPSDHGQDDRPAGTGSDGVDDEYSTLSHDPSHAEPDKARGAAIGSSYDHVLNFPDEDYSKAEGGGRRQVVIDAGYDHVQLI